MPAFNDTHGRPVSTTTATGTTGEACPYCGTSDGVRRSADTGCIHGWACDRCGTDWAFTVSDSRTAELLGDLGAVAQEIRRLRWALAQMITLADQAPQLAAVEL
jgi:ribosomal protein L37AE/L43A